MDQQSATAADAGRDLHGPDRIEVRGARVHNLKNIDASIPLNRLVGIAGVSGSGKSSLALGVLYAEGSRRYLEALSTYTRRRLTQAGRASVDEVLHVPAALALHQRPSVPGVRSTFGTSTELLNSLRLLFSRAGSHVCPNGHRVPPTLNVAAERPITCPVCGVEFFGPGAEDLAFNSGGACPECDGTGIVRTVDLDSLVPDEGLAIDEGAVAPWSTLMWDLMKQVAREMGVRTDVPFNQLTPAERDIVFSGPAEKKHILYKAKKTDTFAELDFTYYNAVYTVENALAKVKDEKGLGRVARFLKQGVCPECDGTRLSPEARLPQVAGIDLAEASAKTLDELVAWTDAVPEGLTPEMRPMAHNIVESFQHTARRLVDLGLGYLALDRAGSTLSTGERQRVQLARAVRNRTTGVLYVLDEPSIGLHPSNIDGLVEVMRDLLADGNSVVMVDHDTRILAAADWLVEMGPGAGADGGRIVAQGTLTEVEANPASLIGGFLSGAETVRVRERIPAADVFAHGSIELATEALHTVKPLEIAIPRGRLTAVTGVSGSGKTTLVLESLIPALVANASGAKLPSHVKRIEAAGIERANLIDATPIGSNVRSTVATYAGVHDELRRAFARTPDAKAAGLKAGDFSYNTGKLRCPECDGTGSISLDVQFLPDVDITCPVCGGSRYAPEASRIHRPAEGCEDPGSTLPQLMAMTVDEARTPASGLKKARARLDTLHELGLGYLTLGEATPALSGGEAQRLKLASEMGRAQDDAVFVFDEPTIGLHPLDVRTLLGVFERLVEQGATVVVIEHDLDVIANADYVVDLGPGGGASGGRIVAVGTPEQVADNPESVTGRYL
ncbi:MULTISPECIES: excinuclease ABC subunit UvrA [Eggerthella]|uniref:excinuclease ABC subunit UvrA n=1 Tax=Eggerthella TaxID=84111 RepID=UPI000DF7ABB5|nr:MULTISPECIES: excinuclease ABC subunit UvrA [Eggerthella]MCC2783158.1 excinuclease ABC subunit UvrA [Eggerthella lenta]MCG4514484.1 excinuclease ABC subunit UvrA [Eggerthella lenta]MDB1778995.1 excinuclease ABC subunit UvrA [Eggerthella lenta]MDU5978729.1 excinuclease ABC subunit UvrA [Eggerthella sp.]MDU6386415.1 excinuclease ABC subunit UvrA [Eggerthella sp.]